VSTNNEVGQDIDLEIQSSILATASSSIEILIQGGDSREEAITRITSIDPFSKDVIKALILKEWK
jgi:hypothetical protein